MLEVHAAVLVTFLEHEPYRCIPLTYWKSAYPDTFTGNCVT